MTFEELQNYLNQLGEAKMRLSIEPSQVYLQALDRPDQCYPSILIGGTNGKGSVCEMLTSCLKQNGLRVGTYTSPHLRTFRERIRLNGTFVEENILTEVASFVRNQIEATKTEGLTYFEFLTMVAAECFRRLEVDWAIFEVGLGGRLDTTNALDRKVLGLTRIGFDHEAILGPEIEKIAAEKAALIRPDVPTFTVGQSQKAMHVVDEVARGKDSPLFSEGTDYFIKGDSNSFEFRKGSTHFQNLELGILGECQVQNAGLALAILDEMAKMGFLLEEGGIRAGLASLSVPGRKEERKLKNGQILLVDVAHNPEATKDLVETLAKIGQAFTVIFGAASDKKWTEMIRLLEPHAKKFLFSPIPFSRSWDPKSAEHLQLARPFEVLSDPREAVQLAAQSNEPILCVGSFYLVDPVLTELEEMNLIETV